MNSPHVNAHPGRLELLDVGRLVAAVSVLFYHYFVNGIRNGKITSIDFTNAVADPARYGYLGVEFFFIISGYVIFHSALGRSAEAFAVSRALRLMPAYWFCVTLTAIAAQFWGGQLMPVSLPQYLANLTMVPDLLGHEYVDGVYWTLAYEIRFYLLILLILLFAPGKALLLLPIAWPMLQLAATLTGMDKLPFLGSYYCYFAAGCCFAALRERGTPMRWLALAITLFLCSTHAYELAARLSATKSLGPRPAVAATIVASMFVFFLLCNTPRIAQQRIPLSALAGGLTYPLYLVHAHIGYMMLSQLAPTVGTWPAYALTIATVFVLAWAVHRFVETRPSETWRSFMKAVVGRSVSVIEKRTAALRT
jgi:peptidoglycan/LPS O-acetylase OafA/YrhL